MVGHGVRAGATVTKVIKLCEFLRCWDLNLNAEAEFKGYLQFFLIFVNLSVESPLFMRLSEKMMKIFARRKSGRM